MDMTTFDIERARRDTPGTANVAHLNNAGAALPPTQVTDAGWPSRSQTRMDSLSNHMPITLCR